MVEIYKNIQLNKVKETDAAFLFDLMRERYGSAYSHFWEDEGAWYVRSQYSQEVILKELLEPQADYYFVIYKDAIVGIFRIVWGEKLKGLLQQKQVKLHRIYLSDEVQGKGIGATEIQNQLIALNIHSIEHFGKGARLKDHAAMAQIQNRIRIGCFA